MFYAHSVNLAVLSKSRRKPKVGSIFAMLPPDGRYLFGRVVSNNAQVTGILGLNLIYIYRARSEAKQDVPNLERTDLLCRPFITNNLPWAHGYFETVSERPLTEHDRHPTHSFLCSSPKPMRYFDEHGNQLEFRTEPCGLLGVDSYRTIDDEISHALGIPLASE